MYFLPDSKTALLGFVPIIVILLSFGAYLGTSVTSQPSSCSSSNSSSTDSMQYRKLNYSAYQITPATTTTCAKITFLYSFPATSGTGSLSMTQVDYGPDFLGNGTFTSCELISTDCSDLRISPSVPQVSYRPASNYTVTFTIDLAQQNGTTLLPSPYFVFYPPSAPCGYYVFLIFGNQVPNDLPTLVALCPRYPANYPNPNVSVVGIQDITGLNIPS